MPRRKAGGLGWGPLALVLFLLIASLAALASGRSLIQLGTRLAIAAALTGLVYVVWHEVSRKNPAFHMGTPEANTTILLLAALGFLFLLASPIASFTGGLVGYPNLNLIDGPVVDYNATLGLGVLFLTLTIGVSLIAVLLLMSRRRRVG